MSPNSSFDERAWSRLQLGSVLTSFGNNFLFFHHDPVIDLCCALSIQDFPDQEVLLGRPNRVFCRRANITGIFFHFLAVFVVNIH